MHPNMKVGSGRGRVVDITMMANSVKARNTTQRIKHSMTRQTISRPHEGATEPHAHSSPFTRRRIASRRGAYSRLQQPGSRLATNMAGVMSAQGWLEAGESRPMGMRQL